MSTKQNLGLFSRSRDRALTEKASDRPLFSVLLSKDLASAVEGWRAANNIATTAEALRELIRLGLLCEISQSYDTVKTIQRTLGSVDV